MGFRVGALRLSLASAWIVVGAGRATADEPAPEPPPVPPAQDAPPSPQPPQNAAPPPAIVEPPQPPVDVAAPWLRPWLPPRPVDHDPLLASGTEASVEVAGGAVLSRFTTAPAIVETGEYGWFVASSTKQALSVEVIEKLNIAVDGVTPEFGVLGGGARRIGRRSGSGLGSIDFERVSTGLALMSRGSNLDVGIGAEVVFGLLTFRGAGLGLGVDAYLFEPSNITGPDKILMVSLGYVYSPMMGTHAAAPIASSAPASRPPSARPACPNAKDYEAALVVHRKLAVAACNQGAADACTQEREIVLTLNARLAACLDGEDVGPPELNDAPPP